MVLELAHCLPPLIITSSGYFNGSPLFALSGIFPILFLPDKLNINQV